jgi:hypothetical protein
MTPTKDESETRNPAQTVEDPHTTRRHKDSSTTDKGNESTASCECAGEESKQRKATFFSARCKELVEFCSPVSLMMFPS